MELASKLDVSNSTCNSASIQLCHKFMLLNLSMSVPQVSMQDHSTSIHLRDLVWDLIEIYKLCFKINSEYKNKVT